MTTCLNEKISDFINEALGISLVLVPYNAERLPFVLKNHYDFFVTVLNRNQFVFIIDKATQPLTPAAIRKHCDMLKEFIEYDIVYATDNMASYERKRLLEQRVGFIVPGRQLYIPTLGIAFKEIFDIEQKKNAILSTCAQLIVLSFLHNKRLLPVKLSDVTKEYDYSKMSVSRAFDELESFELGESIFERRERSLRFNKAGRKLWTAALPCLSTPCKREIEMMSFPTGLAKCQAGLTALSKITMLAAPHQLVAAVALSEWNKFCKISAGNSCVISHGGDIKLQLWRYSPALFGDNACVDKLSLFLSLHNDPDERVKIALDEMMRRFVW